MRCLKLIPVFILVLTASLLYSQTAGEWVWVHGSNFINGTAVYGTKGVPAAGNMPPSAYEACNWTDLNGNFWLFGGASGLDSYNAMWKFDPVIKQWTWMHGPSSPNGAGVYGTMGVPSTSNVPGARGFGVSTWTDLQGNFWLFGGSGYDMTGMNNSLNDLWKFNPVTLEWTWMSGSNTGGDMGDFGTMGVASPTNKPPPNVENHFCWVDNANNLWLYGGQAGWMTADDMWKYSISTSQWTWISGSGSSGNTTNPVYGPLGVESASYSPGTRYGYTSFTDPAGYMYLFGASTMLGFSNDVWRYNPVNNQWAFWGGTNVANDPGSYINKCDTLTNNYPEGAYEMRATWPDSCGFWVFGGYTMNAQSLNNLWYFNSENKKFTWVTGSNIPDDPGNYGSQNVSAPSNSPPARNGAVTWNDLNGNLWLFGGELDFGLTFCYNDLWMYTPDPTCVPLCSKSIFNSGLSANFSSSTAACGSLTVEFHALFNDAAAYTWSFGDGAGTNTQQNPTYTYTAPGSYNVTLIVTDDAGLKDTLVKVIAVANSSQATASFSTSQLSDCLPFDVNFQNNSTNATNYLWSFNDGTAFTIQNPTKTYDTAGTYNVTLIAYGSNNSCNDTSSVSFIVNSACEKLVIPNVFSPDGSGLNDLFTVIVEGFKNYQIEIFDRWGLKVFETTDTQTHWNGKKMNTGSPCTDGTYYYIITVTDKTDTVKKHPGFLSLVRGQK